MARASDLYRTHFLKPGLMRRATLSIFFLASLVALAEAESDLSALRRHHAWGKFAPQAWKKVEVVTESFDLQGRLSGITVSEITSILMAVDEKTYELKVEVVSNVNGKRFVSSPKTVSYGYLGESPNESIDTQIVDEAAVFELDGQSFPVQVREVMIRGERMRRVSRIQFSAHQAPYVLARSTKIVRDGEVTEISVQTLSLCTPYRVLMEMKRTALVKTTSRNFAGATTTVELHCEGVPGGVVYHTSVVRSPEGKTVKRSQLRLLNYGFDGPGAALAEKPLRRPSRRSMRRRRNR